MNLGAEYISFSIFTHQPHQSEPENASIAYLPVRRAFHGQVVLAWRKEAFTPAVADYKRFLSGGCSTDPISLLKIAGVDMSSPRPVNEALQLFGDIDESLIAEDAMIREFIGGGIYEQ